MNALIGTPFGFSQSGSTLGHWLTGEVKRALGCARVSCWPASSPCRASRSDGPAFRRPCLPTRRRVVGQRDVGENEFFAIVFIAFGLVCIEVPGATPKKPASGLIAYRRPSAPV